MKALGWLRFGLRGAQSEELKRVRQRTDQMLRRQEAQKEQEVGDPEREATPAS
jgi:hypothetical protein